MISKSYRISAVCGAIVLMASIAQAQDIASSFDQLRVLVKPGDTITVAGSDGGLVRGRILDLSSAALGLQVNGQRREFSADDVRTISQQRHANLATGAKWGLGIGAGVSVLATSAIWGGGRCDCGALILASSLFYGAVGAGIGVGASALTVSEHLIFARSSDRAVTLGVAPAIGRDRKGIVFTARW